MAGRTGIHNQPGTFRPAGVMRGDEREPSGVPVFKIALIALYVASFAGIAVIAWLGSSYYLTPLAERARHPGYWLWKSGGSVGHPLGIAGSTMMTLMLLYSVRKRVKAFRRLGPLSHWLDVHIYFGIVGPLLVVLHSAFKVGGLVSLSFWSMVAVAGSGVLGRYLYLQIPRTRAGEALTLGDLEKLDAALAARLRDEFRLDAALLERLDHLSKPPARRGLLATLAHLLPDELGLWARVRAFTRDCREVPRAVAREFARVVRDKARAHRRIAIWEAVHALFHYWHVVHKPFAVVMYLFMVVHIAVATMTGYGWLGSH